MKWLWGKKSTCNLTQCGLNAETIHPGHYVACFSGWPMANQEWLPSSYRCGPLKYSVISMFCCRALWNGAAEVILIMLSCWSEDGNTESEARNMCFTSHSSFMAKMGGSKFHLLPYSAEPLGWIPGWAVWYLHHWSPALRREDSRRFLECIFSSAWFPMAGWSAGVRCRVARLFPEREQAGALGAIPGQLRDQLNSQHSSHSPFEGKANREGV